MYIGQVVFLETSRFVSGLLNKYSELGALLLFCILPMLFFLIENCSPEIPSANWAFQLPAFAMLVPFWFVLY